MKMFRDRSTVWLSFRFLWVLLLALPEVDAAVAPTAPATSSGSYTVSYGSCSGCYMVWLEERVGSAGAWTAIGNSSVSFSDKPAGQYDYRAGLLFATGSYDIFVSYSDIATVIVGSNLPTAQPLTQQFRNEYTVRVGYYDGDGTPDLYVERTRGGSGLDGTVEHLILRAVSNGFSPIVPSAGVISAARAWPVAPVRVAMHDVNLDGFADLLLGGIGRLSGLAGMPPQIVFASGRVTVAEPIGVRSVTASLWDLGEDLQGYLRDPDFFANNAPLTIYTSTYYDFSCQYAGFDVLWYGIAEYCYPFPVTTYFVLPDYSVFAAAAVKIWEAESKIESGAISRSSGYSQIEVVIEDSLGTAIADRNLKELLGEAESMVEPALERGVELFAALAGISNAVAQDAEDGTGSSAPDAVQLRGRRIIGFGPFHTALQHGSSTVSAHDSDARALYDGTLVSQVDWPPDHPSLTMQLGRATSLLTPPLYWQRLLAADARYRDHLRYDAIPSIGSGGFNSNGFVAGIVAATSGTTTIPMSQFVGGERPVPSSEFN